MAFLWLFVLRGIMGGTPTPVAAVPLLPGLLYGCLVTLGESLKPLLPRVGGAEPARMILLLLFIVLVNSMEVS